MQDFTKGPVARHVLSVSLFIALTTAFQTLYFLADLYFVGRLGPEAVAGVGLGGHLMMIVLALTQALGVGATTFISQALGAKEKDRAELFLNQSLVLSVTVGLIFAGPLFMARFAYANALAADSTTAARASEYLTWFIPALALQFALVALGAALRGMGDMKFPTMLQITTVVMNIVLAPMLMFGWVSGRPMGVAGTALASFIAIGFGCVAFFSYFLRKTSPLKIRPSLWAPRFRLWADMLKVGLPVGAEFALMFVYLVFVYNLLKPFGSVAQAGFGIGVRVMQSLFLPALAVGFAVSPVVGQNFGARQGERVVETFRAGGKLVSAIMVVLTLLCHIAPDRMIRFFSSDPNVVAIGGDYLQIISWNFLATGLVFVSSSTFQGMGNTLPPLLCSFTRTALFVVPSLWLRSRPGFSLHQLWLVSVASTLVQAALNLWLLRRELMYKLKTRLEATPAGFAPPTPLGEA